MLKSSNDYPTDLIATISRLIEALDNQEWEKAFEVDLSTATWINSLQSCCI